MVTLLELLRPLRNYLILWLTIRIIYTGITLRPGTHVGVPSSWIQRSRVYYENPETFDGYRFLKLAAAGAKNTKLVDLSPDYLVFGMGVHAW
jgi:cytochrome P450